MRSPKIVSRFKTAFTALRTLSLILLAGSLTAHVSAAVITFDDYPSKWQQVNNNGTPLVDTSVVNDVRRIRIVRNADNVGSAAIFYTGGVNTATEANQFSDFSGSVMLSGMSSSSSYARGVLLRSSTKTFSGGYYVGVIPGGSTPGLGIFWNYGTGFSPTVGNTKAFDGFTALTTGLSYKLTFQAEGTIISAALWGADVNGNYVTELASVQYLTATESATGYFAIQGGRYGGNSVTAFSEFNLTTIPEPHSIAAILVGGALIFGVSRRKGKRL